MSDPRRSSETVRRETTEIAQVTAAAAGASSLGGMTTAAASAVALVFSAISLYHSVLKQPELDVHLSQVVHYTRDANGNFEVFAVPLTIANHGARDGTVTGLELKVSRIGAEGSEEPKAFYSAYSVDGSFFVPPGRFDFQAKRFERVDRPKEPFAPIAVPGRGSFSGTLLFYTKGSAFPKVVSEAGEYELELTLNSRLDQSLGVLDEMLTKPQQPARLQVKLGHFSESELLKGGTHRMTNTEWAKTHASPEDPAK